MPANLTILLAEDSAVIQKMITATLARVGHTVEAVSNGREAVEAVRDRSFDLVMMDLRMPVLDGLDATREIRTLDVEQPPIVALSGDHDAGTVQTCLDAGMDGHLTKPVVLKDMLAIIDKLTSV